MATDDEDRATGDPKDRELLARWVEGERKAGDELTTRYFRRLRTFFRRRIPGEHEDLVQETCLQLARSKSNYRGDAPVWVFVFKIARNVMLQHFRKVSRQPKLDTYTSSLGEARGRRPSSMLDESENHRLLLDALQDISIDHHDLLTFHYWDELTGPELSKLFDVAEGTIRSRLGAARKRLRERFEELCQLPRERMPTEEIVEKWLRELRAAS